jgi:hypothetical protein
MHEREQDRHRHVHAAGVIHVRVAPARGLLIRQRRQERETRHRLHDRAPGLEVGVRAAVAEAAVRDVDDVGLQLPQSLVAEAPALEHALREILAHHVGALHDLGQDLARPLGTKIQRDAELLDVVIIETAAEIRAAALVHERRHRAQDVPEPHRDRVFDADHLRTERGEPLRGAGAGELAGEVADAEMAESGGHSSILRPIAFARLRRPCVRATPSRRAAAAGCSGRSPR